MINADEKLNIIPAKNQLFLHGYDYYFNSFIKLYRDGRLPNTILLSGPKGSGKATFAYHFINYLLSFNEENNYSLNNFYINPDNKSYINLCNNTHPNFSLLESNSSVESIKIVYIRNLLKFLNQSTYSSGIKIVLIDDVEYLNIHSSNALLKVLEESNDKTYFFLINDNSKKILNTIKSRCIEFKFFFTFSEKKKILEDIIKLYDVDLNNQKIHENFYFETPGNILKYLILLKDSKIDFVKDKLTCILYLFDEFKTKNDQQFLTFTSLLIELLFNELAIKNNNNLHLYSSKKIKLLQQIDDAKKFNLDKKNLFISLRSQLENE